jgi:hypothetical protein
MLEDKLGVEYGYSVLTAAGIAKNYRYLGSRCVKFSDVTWGDIQPTGPITIFFWTYRSYNWSKLDAAVKDWQQFGYDIHMVLRSKNSWATQATVYPPAGMPYSSAASCPPKAQYWTEYSEFIKQVLRPLLVLTFLLMIHFGMHSKRIHNGQQYLRFLLKVSL